MLLYNHQYHLVNMSPWPLTSSLGLLYFMTGIINFLHMKTIKLLTIGTIIILLSMYLWWRDISRESTFQGFHTNQVLIGLKWGMVLFIISEILFFMSFFWSFFHSSLSPTLELGLYWPPSGINTFDPFKIPLLNTIILISSGITITWSHNSLINKNYSQTFYSLMLTLMLSIYFSILQNYEYMEATFNISDSIYGSSFFMSTGFHGIHVLIGTMFISICFIRHFMNHFSSNHYFGFEAAAWYWHFVDIIWLFLYLSIYWWGS